MRVLAFLLLLGGVALAVPAPVLQPLPMTPVGEYMCAVKSQSMMYGPSSPTNPGNLVYIITHVPAPYGPQTPGVWIPIDIKPFLDPACTKGRIPNIAFSSGLLIITHGTAQETANLLVTFRAHNSGEDPNCDQYLGQTLEAINGSGQRSNFSTTIPLDGNGVFDICYRVNTPGSYPGNSSYGINMSLQWVGFAP